MKVQSLRYTFRRRARHEIKRCEAKVAEATQRWRIHAGKDDQCELSALFVIDGRYFCKRHAGDELLNRLAKTELVLE